MEKEKIKKILTIIGAIVVIWFLFIQNGGDTITLLNRSSKDICEVYFAFDPEENGWGRNLVSSKLKNTHSRDIRLPIFFEWFANSAESGYSGRTMDCEGNEIDTMDGIGIDTNFFIWEVR